MAKTRSSRRRNVDMWTGAGRDSSLDTLFSSMRDEARHELGRDDISIGDEAARLIVGLPLPALALRYLFQSTVFPLSRITQVVGQEGTAKSAFLFEVMRWHMCYGGGAIFGENENKDSPELRQALLGWNQAWLARLELVPCRALEDWQEMLSTCIRIAANKQDAADGPGRTIPIVFGVDSLMATAPREEIQRTTVTDGFASRGFALAAQLIARYMRAIPHMIQDYPFSIVGTNHLKPSTDHMGRPIANVPGGKSVQFMETFEIESRREPGADIDRREYGGLRLRLLMRKNSLGPSRKHIVAELLWWTREIGGVLRPWIVWDWSAASIELLLSFATRRGGKNTFNHLMSIVDINVADAGKCKAWSAVLGVPRTAPVDYRRLGAILEERDDLLPALHEILGVQQRFAFQPGEDYRRLLAAAQQRSDDEMAAAAAAPVPLPEAPPATEATEETVAAPAESPPAAPMVSPPEAP